MNKELYIEVGQNITDICLQEYGSLDNFFLLLKTNGFTTLPVEITAGTKLIIPEATTNKTITSLLNLNKPATDKAITETLKQGGIDFMGIEINFIVS